MAQVVDLRSVLRGLRRRRQVVLAAVLVGLVAAGLFVVVSPTTYIAKARVVLPPSPVDSSGHDTRDINTEVQIVRGTAVLAPITKAVQPSIALSDLQRAISVRGISSQIIEISAHSGDATRAAQLANAVAGSYVAFADDTATAEANATASAYAQEVSQLDQQVQQLDQQIASNTVALTGLGPADAQRRTAVIDTLRSEQAALAQQLNVDQSRIADSQLQSQLSRQGTQVLQPALTPTHPASPKPVTDIALGVLGGLLIGGIVALAIENGDHRLGTRDGIAEAVRSPVLASLAVPPLDAPEPCRTFLQSWEPSVVESYALRQGFARLGLDGTSGASGTGASGTGASGTGAASNLVLVGLEGDDGAAALVLELAVFTVTRGTQTALIFASHDEAGASLRAACSAAAPGGLSPRPGLVIHGASGGVDPDLLDGAELAITFVVADSGPIVIPTWDRPTQVALVASAGRFTADRLEAVAAACLDAGGPLGGVFVADPDPGDRTTGQRGGVRLGADGLGGPGAGGPGAGGLANGRRPAAVTPELTAPSPVTNPSPVTAPSRVSPASSPSSASDSSAHATPTSSSQPSGSDVAGTSESGPGA
jgi:capsular polysaccharide biosynthesis protein